jgi:geranylgeranyl diphosphate synthase type I
MKETDFRTSIQEAMRAAFPQAEERVAGFYAMQEYHLGWRDSALQAASFDMGKLLRPQFTLLGCAAVGGDVPQALPLAAGIQLIHDFSLIHDDIEDNSDTRRGRVTVWKQWGLAQGINTGDGMFVLAHLAVHQLAERGVPAERVLAVLRRFDETILRVCEGQFLDLSFEGRLEISEDDYLAMIGRKTAALIAGATSMGALVGGADAASTQALFAFGENLGLAFQVQDDILGIWGDPAATGKPYAADIYQRKLSLPMIYGLRRADERQELAHIYSQESIDEAAVARVLAVLDTARAREYTEEVAQHYHNQAMHALAQVQSGDSPHAAAALARLRSIAEGLVGRSA